MKFRQTVALILLFSYFIIKIFSSISYQRNDVLTDQNFIYLLDSGHGYYGEDCGSKAIYDIYGRCFYEWIYNWDIRIKLMEMLDSAGIKYIPINIDLHSDMGIVERANKANIIKTKLPKVYISIHGNAASTKKKGWESVEGFEVYSPTESSIIKGSYDDKKEFSDTIATWMSEEIKKEFPEHIFRENSGTLYKENSFTVISKTKCYSILTENEFFTNPIMREKMLTDNFRTRVARSHFNLILRLEKYKK